MGNLLEIHDVYQKFGDNVVLSGVNLVVERGKIYTVLGNNGSGKSTLFNIISGFLTPTSGRVEYRGKDITGLTPFRVCDLGIRRTFQDLRLAKKMTVLENVLLSLQTKMFGSFDKTVMDDAYAILESVSLLEKAKERAGEISFGQQKLLTLGCCIACSADLLLLDEPVAGIDANNQMLIMELVMKLRTQEKTILQIEHDDRYIKSTSDSVFCLEKGKIVCWN